MKGTINLRKPIKIDGHEVNTLTYDTDKITLDDYLKALNLAVVKSGGITGANIKLDSGAQVCIGMYAVLADNPRYDITDIERVSGTDIMKFADIGMSFISGREDPIQGTSEEPSEPIVEPSILTAADYESEA